MARKISMLASGLSPGAASAITGDVSTTNPAGNSQATAQALLTVNTYTATVAAGSGYILPATADVGDAFLVENDDSADAVLVYPHVGGEVGTGATNAGFSVAAGKTALFTRMTRAHWSVLLSA